MSGFNFIARGAIAFVLATNATLVFADEKMDNNIQAELKLISKMRIFFGHQSVGENLLAGVKELSNTSGVPITITKVSKASDISTSALGHAFVERNGEPLMKLQSFEKAFEQRPSGVDIALVKFCYVDINANTDAKALFAKYHASLEALKARNPGTTFVHVTAPLTSEKSGPKEFLKRLLGRGNEIQNVRREEYNAIMRKTYQGREPIFDLARVESTTPDGKAVTVEWNGNKVPAMASAYTDDGGHLNSAGQLHAARELISVLSSIPVKTASGKAAR